MKNTIQVIVQVDADKLSEIIEKAVRKVLLESPASNSDKSGKPLSIKEAAEFLSLSVSSIYGLVHRKQIPVSKRGRHLYFNRKELSDWLQRGRKLTVEELSLSAKIKLKELGGNK